MDEDARLGQHIADAGSGSPEALSRLVDALAGADGYILSQGGTPIAPNPRFMQTKDGRTWVMAYTSVARAVAGKPAADGIVRAPMPVICGVGRIPGVAGVCVNPGERPSVFIQGDVLKAIAEAPGSGHAIEMADPAYPNTMTVKVRLGGQIELDGNPVTVDQLRAALTDLKALNGLVQYTRDSPETSPSEEAQPAVDAVLALVAELRLPVRMITEVRPQPPS